MYDVRYHPTTIPYAFLQLKMTILLAVVFVHDTGGIRPKLATAFPSELL